MTLMSFADQHEDDPVSPDVEQIPDNLLKVAQSYQ